MPFYYKLDRHSESGVRTAQGLLRLRAAMAGLPVDDTGVIDSHSIVPRRTRDDTLLLATWNLRNFGSVRDAKEPSGRLPEALHYIAEIISHFDLVAVQEVTQNLEALEQVIDIMGGWWDYLLTDVTEGRAGNRERAAYVYDTRKVRFGGLAGEIVIPPVEGENGLIEPAEQLARTPFVCGFRSGWLKFMLCSVHIIYGESTATPQKRVEEIQTLSTFLANRIEQKYSWGKNLALLGDFNIFEPDDVTFTAITDAGFYIPTSFRDKPTNVKGDKHFDQIAFFSTAYDPDVVKQRLENAHSGVFNFFKYVFRNKDELAYANAMPDTYHKKTDPQKKSRYYQGSWRTYQMSDHFPLWIELPIDFAEPYLQSIADPKSSHR
jgi:endonuclease/exonuclease/phosphatase family metal-dependent hydrolase